MKIENSFIFERVNKTARHTTFYLEAGSVSATPIIFVHGWPELSVSWRQQLVAFAGLGLRAIAPDMRGYGRSTIHPRHEDYALEEVVTDMIELLDSLGAQKAIWVGHDFGAPVVWLIAQHHVDRCHGVAAMSVPYIPDGLSYRTFIPLIDRNVYPESTFPAGQWEYMLFYEENFEKARAGFEADIGATVRALFRAGAPGGMGQPAITAFPRRNGSWFPPDNKAPDMPRDDTILTLEEENRYVAALSRTGFFGPDSYYMNNDANMAYSARVKDDGRLSLPTLFVHAAYDYVCATVDTRLADPMREACDDLTEAVVKSGHWMAQEKPSEVNAAIAKWLAARLPDLWPG
ncbi:epoxide hydrolase (plasmid) [Sphingomonas panacis]|uniref:Epoxide hydrolase n=1 Tax=Sphingomonas panacis TaxID=1560345 RepID=A0A1B3ZII4_9SPHN|nr:alpha/beta hydrolase [Sphingomonas panacis]AOH87229.1 epoxide hydrolase [Sphingomonas panacis]